MTEKFIRKLQRTSSYSYVINIPKELIDRLTWQEKQKLEIIFDNDRRSVVVRDWKKR